MCALRSWATPRGDQSIKPESSAMMGGWRVGERIVDPEYGEDWSEVSGCED